MLAQNLDLNEIQKQAIPKGSTFNFANKSLGDIISALLPYLFSAAGILLLLYLVYGGLQLMLSGGDPKAVQSARDKITGALIGFIIIFAAYWITQIIANMLGLKSILDTFK